MRLGTWAVAAVGFVILSASGCLTSQDNPSDGGGVEAPPVSTSGSGGSSGSTSQGGAGGEDTGGSAGKGGASGRGGSGGSSGSGKGGSGAGGACSDDADCAASDARTKCSVPTGDCVECLGVGDCEASEDCVNNTCQPFTTCATTDDCSRGLVCNSATNRCVECVGSTDCATGDVCVSNTCNMACTSDSQCIRLGLRCNTSAQICVSCVNHADCPETQNCQQGSCVRDICVGGSTSCDENNSLATCNAAGSQLSSPTPCGSQYSCTEDSSGARCEPWICTPGTMGCSQTGERVVTCSDDGLSETLEDDCEAADQLCIGTVGGMCSDAVCEPSARFCQSNTTIHLCDSTGTSSTIAQTCTGNLLCNPQTVTCTVPLCTPNQPTCDGNVYTTCNAQGFGYTGTRTDCAATDQFCGATGCTTSAVDTIPASPTLLGSTVANYLMVNIYSVRVNRTLSSIEQYMSPTAAITLTWHVYESTTTQTGSYTSISSTTTTSTTGIGYQSSGALAVPLVAGRFYAIGLSWTTAVNCGYQTTAPFPPQPVSFGSIVAGSIVSTTAPTSPFTFSMSTSAYVPQRLTTAP